MTDESRQERVNPDPAEENTDPAEDTDPVKEETKDQVQKPCCCAADEGKLDTETAEEAEQEGEGSVCDCGNRRKRRTPEEVRKLTNRLKRIEGQIRGIEAMLANDAYCPDIMIQVSAVNCALNSFNKELLAQHLRSCVVDDIRAGKEESIDELVKVLQKVMK